MGETIIMLFLLNTVGLSERVRNVEGRYVVEDLSDIVAGMRFRVDVLFADTNEIAYYVDDEIVPNGVLYEDWVFERVDGVRVELRDDILRAIVIYAIVNRGKTVRDLIKELGGENLKPNERTFFLGYVSIAIAMGLIKIPALQEFLSSLSKSKASPTQWTRR